LFSVNFDVHAWSAWAPGLQSAAEWRDCLMQDALANSPADDILPDVSFVPALQRRRLSRLSKMSLSTLYQCVDGKHNYRSVFASPHGEIHRTVELLQALAKKEPLSPMGFSLSVHNTAAGIYSIISGNKAPSTSVASGRDTLEQAMIEAVTQSEQCGEAVLLVYADEPLPAQYNSDFAIAFPFSLAMLVQANQQGAWKLQAGVETDLHKVVNSSGMAPLYLLTDVQRCVAVHGERYAWQWSYSGK
jgi:hypothetical protein